jgi:hypothetical protein
VPSFNHVFADDHRDVRKLEITSIAPMQRGKETKRQSAAEVESKADSQSKTEEESQIIEAGHWRRGALPGKDAPVARQYVAFFPKKKNKIETDELNRLAMHIMAIYLSSIEYQKQKAR